MTLKLRRLALLLPWLGFVLAGCSTHTQVNHAARPDQMHHIFVEHLLADGHNIDELIARELRRLGYDASAGPLTMMPEGTQAILAYQTSWAFDFTTYLIELDVALRDAKSGEEIAVSKKFRPSIIGNDPSAMIQRVVDKIFPPQISGPGLAGAPDGTRTRNIRLRRQVLYPIELRDQTDGRAGPFELPGKKGLSPPGKGGKDCAKNATYHGSMVTINGEYQGELHCTANHGPSGTQLVTDAPSSGQVEGRFSPTDDVATAFATCIATTMAIVARPHGVDLAGLRYTVTKEMSVDAPRRISASSSVSQCRPRRATLGRPPREGRPRLPGPSQPRPRGREHPEFPLGVGPAEGGGLDRESNSRRAPPAADRISGLMST